MSAEHPLPLEFESRLVEEAVLLAMRGRPDTGYWREREDIYRIDDAEERDRRFTELCRRQFEALRLAAPIEEALEEQPGITRAVRGGWVVAALARKDEGAELFVAPETAARSLVVKLRAASFARPEELHSFLRQELFHIADMVDPAFGCEPALPAVEGGAVRLKLALSRYRVLWDTVIDSRLARRGRAAEGARARRASEFAAAFAMLGEAWRAQFERWFAEERPTHPKLLEYALDPAAAAGIAAPKALSTGICPLCRLPGASSPAGATSLPAEVIEDITRDFPAWRPADGLCRQCEDLYRLRPMSRAAAGRLT